MDGPRKTPKDDQGRRFEDLTLRQKMQLRGEALEEPEPPEGVSHIWGWFWELHRNRCYAHGQAYPLDWKEVLAWKELTGVQLEYWHQEVLRAMDLAFCAAWNSLDAENTGDVLAAPLVPVSISDAFKSVVVPFIEPEKLARKQE